MGQWIKNPVPLYLSSKAKFKNHFFFVVSPRKQQKLWPLVRMTIKQLCPFFMDFSLVVNKELAYPVSIHDVHNSKISSLYKLQHLFRSRKDCLENTCIHFPNNYCTNWFFCCYTLAPKYKVALGRRNLWVLWCSNKRVWHFHCLQVFILLNMFEIWMGALIGNYPHHKQTNSCECDNLIILLCK